MRARAGLLAILLAILVASCGPAPHGVDVTVAGESAPTVVGSTTYRTACSAEHGDAFPQEIPLTTVKAATVTLHFQAASGTTALRGAIYADAAPGEPLEQFTLSGAAGTYEAKAMVPGRTYRLFVNAEWSYLITGGSETRLFRVRVEPP